MAIELNGLGSNTPNQRVRGADQNTPANRSSDVDTPTSSANLNENVKFSDQAQQLAGNPNSDIDQSRVDAIKAAINQGQYGIDAQKLAKDMMSFENDF
ncbi:flagellar biosynthesis anti-sigma factor FlgM [Terasakiispira papahanaumokuakeensis]|uniref:Negative regulator of flagellin synthesis n=1 Tax=Terasakiispira papahanaumokuakeensis TaxID=197479 RepID=A0A1E2V6I2_9GAMM|nr:flagellar biosynthesis anti-sigma factor FlgM [Terasakiispira papahanaumokuakeensis]ODC02456.1 flagellar biosynthesis anti-sigma factor FlgM [Terasakiispira papahanaumokuakeensis]